MIDIQLANFNQIKKNSDPSYNKFLPWRELNFDFLSILEDFSCNPISYIIYNKFIFAFFDNTTRNSLENSYYFSLFNGYLSLFSATLSDSINLKRTCLVFLPEIHNDENFCGYEFLPLLENILNEKKIVLVGRDQIMTQLSANSKNCTYNTYIRLDSMNYLDTLDSHTRQKAKKYIRLFGECKYDFRVFDLANYCEQAYRLYNQVCQIYHEQPEPYFIWEHLSQNIRNGNINWYGIFYKDELILCLSAWKDKTNAVLSFFGKNNFYADDIKCNYLMHNLFIKTVQSLYSQGIVCIYNGFGHYEMKKQLGFRKINFNAILF